MSPFDVRKYNGSYLSCSYAPSPMKSSTFIDEWVAQNKSISNSHEGFKILLNHSFHFEVSII